MIFFVIGGRVRDIPAVLIGNIDSQLVTITKGGAIFFPFS